MKTKLIIVRHAEAEGNALRVFHGQTDANLTEKGHAQLAALVKKFKEIEIDCIYSSDLIRAYTTAKAIAKLKDLPITTSEKLREVNAGAWEGVAFADLPNLYPDIFHCWENEPHLTVFPDGESIKSFYERAYPEIMRIVKENPGRSICVVTHGTVLRSALCTFKGLPLEQLQKVSWGDNTAITIIDFDEEWSPEVVTENDNAHIMEDGLSTITMQEWWQKQHDEKGKIRES